MAKRILAVDDNEDVLETIDLILSMEGYDVRISPLPENIGNDIIDFKPDLILLDIQMGSFNGLDICQKLKANPYTSAIPVIIISSHDHINNAVEKFGANDILQKPFKIDQLIVKVEKFLAAKIIPLNKAS